MGSGWILLMPISFSAVFLTVRAVFLKRGASAVFRDAVLSAMILWFGLLVFITEINSLLATLNRPGLVVSWSLTVALFFILYFKIKQPKSAASGAMRTWSGIREYFRQLSFWDGGLILLAAALIGILGTMAFVAAPNNFDSMTTHLIRAVYWMQNSSVRHFPTPDVTQLCYPAAAAYGVLHTMTLSTTDRWANGPQFISWIGTACIASLMARHFCLSRRGQALAALFALTVPIGIMEATSTQNDLVTAFFLSGFVYYVCRLSTRYSRIDVGLCGLSLGLAIFAKSYALLYGFPFGCWLVWILIRSRGWNIYRPLAAMGMLILVPNIGLWSRNIDVFGAWMPSGMNRFVMESHAFLVLFSAWLKNIALQIGTPFEPLNVWMDRGIHQIHEWIGVSVADPRLSLISPDLKCCVQKNITNEDFSPNPLHFVLSFGASTVVAVRAIRKKTPAGVVWLWILLTAGVTTLCFYLKWHPFFTRYHVFYYAAAAPLVAFAFDRCSKRALRAVAFMLLIASIPWIFWNDLRPLVGPTSIFKVPRERQYFAHRPQAADHYLHAALWIRENNWRKIGLITRLGDWVYPLWAILTLHLQHPFEMRHVEMTPDGPIQAADPFGVNDAVSRIPQEPFEPDAVVSVGLMGLVKNQEDMKYLQERYGRIYIFGTVYVFTKKAKAAVAGK